MGREAKGQNDPLEAVAMLQPVTVAVHDPKPLSSWPVAPRTGEPAKEVATAQPALTRWFDALDPETASGPEPQRQRLWAVPLLMLALVLVTTARTAVSRVVLPIALAAAALTLLVGGRRKQPPAPAKTTGRGLGLDERQLLLHIKDNLMSHALLTTSERFGVTLLATPRRDRVVALLSSNLGMSYVGASFDAPSRRAFGTLLDRASIVSADEVGLEAIGPDGEPISLAPSTLAALVDELSQRSPGCLERLLVTDARGTPLSLDGRELRAGGREFDLTAPIEWRAFVFQEALGQAIAVYQGTWIRQGTSEIVLVCLLPAMTSAIEGMGVALSSLDRGALRDLRLMQGSPEGPPPPDQRVAIDRLLVVPIRSALDKAPRTETQAPHARA